MLPRFIHQTLNSCLQSFSVWEVMLTDSFAKFCRMFKESFTTKFFLHALWKMGKNSPT